jgi:hypothetical protein
MADLRTTPSYLSLGLPWAGGGTVTAFTIDSAYVHRTSGDAVAVRYMARSNEPINELYVFLDAVTGTLGSITMEADIYDTDVTLANRPGTTLLDTSTTTTMPNAVDKWIKFEFATPYTPDVGEILWLIIKNTSATPATNAPLIRTANNAGYSQSNWATGFVSANGFSGAGTLATELSFVVKEGDNYRGNPTTESVTNFNPIDANKKGIVVTPPFDCVPVVLETVGVDRDNTAIEIFEEGQLPTDTPIWSQLLEQTGRPTDNLIGAFVLIDPPTLRKGKTYFMVIDTTAGASPNSIFIRDYSSYSTVFDAFVDNINHCESVREDSGAWVRSSEAYPRMGLLIGQITSQTISSAS